MGNILIPTGYGEAEHTERKSRFIGHIWHVETEAEAIERIRETRTKHWNARHNVYAYLLRNGGTIRCSDDGEPSGSSGIPTLNVFQTGGITDLVCVVTRYFGGILLGVGGLARAYSKAAKLALEASGISSLGLWKHLLLSCSYAQQERIRRLLSSLGGVVENTDFGTDVLLEALLPVERLGEFERDLGELTAGTAFCEVTGESFRATPVSPQRS